MIIIDTNVISETLKQTPNINVMGWIDAQSPFNLYLSAITLAEMQFGMRTMPNGRKKDGLSTAIQYLHEVEFKDRILPFDSAAAIMYGAVMSNARERGLAVSQMDGLIGATALANVECSVATRDISPFIAMGVDCSNPWDYTG